MKYLSVEKKLGILYDINHSRKKKQLRYQQLLKYLKDKSSTIRSDTLARLDYSFKKYLQPQDILPAIYDTNQENAMEAIRILTFELGYKDQKIFERSLEILRNLKMTNWPYGCNLIEALEEYPELITWKKIAFLFDYPHQVVRGYAYYLLRLFKQYKNKLYELLKEEDWDLAKIDIFIALYELGDKQYLEKLINLIVKTSDETAQQAGIIILKRHTNRKNFKTILEYFFSDEVERLCLGAQKEVKSGINIIYKRFPRLTKKMTLKKDSN